MPSNPFLAAVGLRVEPAPLGAGVTVGLEVELGSMPSAFFTAVEESVRATLLQGPHGWEIPDCAVTITHSGYWGRHSVGHADFTKSISSTAADFRCLAPLVLMTAVQRARTTVCVPMHRFELEIPERLYATVLAALPRLSATPLETRQSGGRLVVGATCRRWPCTRSSSGCPTSPVARGSSRRASTGSRPRWDRGRLGRAPTTTRPIASTT